VFLTLASLEGAIELAGKKAEKGAVWEKDGLLRSGDHLARFILSDGTRLTLRPRAELLLRGDEAIALDRGEIYCEVVPGAGRKLSVITPDATIQVTGTQFAVKRTDHTEVFVTAGEVRVSNEKGEVAVPAGSATLVRKSSAPARPRAMDGDLAVGWRRTLDPPEVIRLRYDFEDNRKPNPWQGGRVVEGPPRGQNKGCLEGSPGISLDLSRLDRRISTVRGTLKFRFRYYATGGEGLLIQFFDDRVRDNFRSEVKPLAHRVWETFEAPLSDFYLLADGAAKIQELDRLSWLSLSATGAQGPVFFDDIELVEVMK
jgi:hypothetical protein